MACLA